MQGIMVTSKGGAVFIAALDLVVRLVEVCGECPVACWRV